MAAASRRSESRVIVILGLILVVGIAGAIWLALRSEPAPPAPAGAPAEKPKSEGHPPATHVPRQKDEGPIPFEPGSTTRPPVDRPPSESDESERILLDVQVIGSNGVDAAGATVLVLDPFAQHPRGSGRIEIARATTDDSGHARFEVRRRTVRVYAWRDNEVGVSEKRQVTDSQRVIAVILAPGVAARGRVVESGGLPVEGADVRFLLTWWQDDRFGLALATKSARDGVFALPPVPLTAFDVPQNGASIEARAKGWPKTTVPVTADTLRAGEVVIRLDRGAFVRGRLVTASGRGAAKAPVLLADGRASVETDAEGRFELPLPRDGGVALTTRIPTHDGPAVAGRLIGQFRGDAGDVDVGDIAVGPGQTVKGVVVYADEKPVKAGDVALYLAGVQVGATQTDDAGTFELDSVGDDAHLLVATEAPGENAWSGRRHASSPEVRGGMSDVRVVITGALSVLAKFAMSSDRSPVVVPEVRLRVDAVGGTPQQYGWSWAGSRIDQVRFEVEHAGTYTATFELPGYEVPPSDPFEVSDAGEVTITVLFQKKP